MGTQRHRLQCISAIEQTHREMQCERRAQRQSCLRGMQVPSGATLRLGSMLVTWHRCVSACKRQRVQCHAHRHAICIPLNRHDPSLPTAAAPATIAISSGGAGPTSASATPCTKNSTKKRGRPEEGAEARAGGEPATERKKGTAKTRRVSLPEVGPGYTGRHTHIRMSTYVHLYCCLCGG